MSENDELQGWFAGRVPEGWFSGPPEVTADREEILVVGTLADVEVTADATEAVRAAARESRVDGFRQETREHRMRIASEAQHRFRRRVSWGATCGGVRKLFTVHSAPAMTRLRMEDRAVLDTLVEAGVARSRSEALAWCVRLVGANQSKWIEDLRGALTNVEKVRSEGPPEA